MLSLAALSDPTRRRIIELLAKEEYTAGEIVGEFDLSAPAISQHLKILREAGLVLVRVEGQRRVYAVNPEGFTELDTWLHRLHGLWATRKVEVPPPQTARPRRVRPTRPAKPLASPAPTPPAPPEVATAIIMMETP